MPNMRRKLRDIKRILSSEGACLVSVIEKRHLHITFSVNDIKHTVVAAKTPSCWRSLRNFKSEVRRRSRGVKDN